MASQDLGRFRQEVIKGHNSVRSRHSCAALIASEELTKSAQAWAEAIVERGYLQYSETIGVGESILFLEMNGKLPTGDDVTREWYHKQLSSYDFGSPRWRKGAMNLSQMLWRSTSEVGVGVAKDPRRDRWVVVAHYRPPGNNNLPGEFRKNVLPAS